MIFLKDILSDINGGYLIKESKQSIINLGYPEIIAKLFYQKFGNKAFLLARWFKEYHTGGDVNKKDWWSFHFGGFGTLKLHDYVNLYYSTSNPEEYLKMLKHLSLSCDDISNYGQTPTTLKGRGLPLTERDDGRFDYRLSIKC